MIAWMVSYLVDYLQLFFYFLELSIIVMTKNNINQYLFSGIINLLVSGAFLPIRVNMNF